MTKSSRLLATTEEPDVLKIIGERLDASGILFTLCHPVTEVFNLMPLGSAIKVDLIGARIPNIGGLSSIAGSLWSSPAYLPGSRAGKI